MKKALIVYYSTQQKSTSKKKLNEKNVKEINKITNEEKTAQEIKKLLEEKNFLVELINLVPKKELKLKDQFKKEKEIILTNTIPSLTKFDLVLIGTPIVGAITSSPLINSFIRGIIIDKKQKKPFFAVYSTGILHGFELKKMISLIGMKGIKPIHSKSFCSIFDFDSKKLLEVKKFVEDTLKQTNLL